MLSHHQKIPNRPPLYIKVCIRGRVWPSTVLIPNWEILFPLYVFQGATIKTLTERLSLNYEWDFGVTYGWKAYDKETHPENRVIGSKMTAYIDLGLYLRWMLSKDWDPNVGATVLITHYSNSNTAIPNAGLNVLRCKGWRRFYYIGRRGARPSSWLPTPSPPF